MDIALDEGNFVLSVRCARGTLSMYPMFKEGQVRTKILASTRIYSASTEAVSIKAHGFDAI